MALNVQLLSVILNLRNRGLGENLRRTVDLTKVRPL